MTGFISKTAAIYGVQGLELADNERAFLRESNPMGMILFARNIESKSQVKSLTDSLYDLLGDDLMILVDQEGGRVARLKPPIWPSFPPAQDFADLDAVDQAKAAQAVKVNHQLIAATCREVGINVACAPMLDVRDSAAHEIVGDRAFGETASQVSRLGRAAMEGLLSYGALPVIKHIPGHGRALVDSHEDLPVVSASLAELRERDFAPFKALNDAPMAMSAHIRYDAIDSAACATMSEAVITLIRSEIGFDGLLMTDDLSMKALSGDFAERTSASLAAGCDIALHCNGEMNEMEAIASAAPTLTGLALKRTQAAWKALKPAKEVAISELTQQRDALLA